MASNFVTAVKIEGGDRLLKELQALGGNVKSTARTAIRNGIKVMQVQAEDNARPLGRRGKHTRIGMKATAGGDITARLGPSKRFWYYKFLETGTQPHEEPHSRIWRHHPGMAAQPWLRPAFDAKQMPAATEVGATFRRAIEERRAIIEAGEEEEE